MVCDGDCRAVALTRDEAWGWFAHSPLPQRVVLDQLARKAANMVATNAVLYMEKKDRIMYSLIQSSADQTTIRSRRCAAA